MGEHHFWRAIAWLLSYLVKVAKANESYTVFRYMGKQVRDQIYSTDGVNAFLEFAKNPRPGEVYNLGGRENSASNLECFECIGSLLGTEIKWTYSSTPQIGDQIDYVNAISRFPSHYPDRCLTLSRNEIIERMVRSVPR